MSLLEISFGFSPASLDRESSVTTQPDFLSPSLQTLYTSCLSFLSRNSTTTGSTDRCSGPCGHRKKFYSRPNESEEWKGGLKHFTLYTIFLVIPMSSSTFLNFCSSTSFLTIRIISFEDTVHKLR